MMIQVNENIDEYREDFYKGLTLRQTLFAGSAVAVGAAAYLFLNIMIGLPQTAALYAALPVVFPIAAAGFLKIHGMTLSQYLKARKRVKENPVYYFKPQLMKLMEETGLEDGEAHPPKKDRTNRQKQRMLLIAEGDDGYDKDAGINL